MPHAAAYIIFILPFTAWLGFELKRKYSLSTHWPWLLAAFVTGIIGAQVYHIYPTVHGNFALHASGGMASCFLYIYLLRTLKITLSWRLAIVMLFAFVSMLGVLNELAEYAFELLGAGPLSIDTHDTWRDFVANTTGAFLVWGLYALYLYTQEQFSSRSNKARN